jgi:hypothetical protein
MIAEQKEPKYFTVVPAIALGLICWCAYKRKGVL